MFGYFSEHSAEILGYLWDHFYLSVIPVVLGLVVALPLGWVANRFKWTYPPVITIAGLLYTIPSLVLFVVMPGILGTQILSVVNVIVALTVYAVALLVRVVADGLASVSFETKQAATAMGYQPVGRFFKVELPLAVPVIAAGVRVATVSNVSLVTVATFVGTDQLGRLFNIGLQLSASSDDWADPILIGIILSVLLALVLDALILLGTRLLTPWRRAVRA
ncbi:ABC transporter permease subunit [Nakamurella sp. YIM 132087]|uniref:ABC transporter permease subunit n=1 Tax=Nakamurella alba TaxID=2665158 RepID=A0A7K1FK16_9ACTN|nr:ABC transporter permease [Nakamurella alba]MTD14448.1 ABC transporter permease subunit [Nakamurella alba]